MKKNSKRKPKLYLSHFESITEKQIYLFGDILFLIGHISYLIMFHLLGVVPMQRYNYFSVFFYALMIYPILRVKERSLFVFVVLMEIIIHSGLSAYFVGCGKGFELFLLFIVPIPFFMPLRSVHAPYVMSALDFALLILLRLYDMGNSAPFTIEAGWHSTIVYLMNVFFGFVIIIYISSIYLFSREILQFKMKAQNESLQKLASVDPLTQLFNRRAMGDFLKLIKSASEASGKTYVVGLGDIDDFKHINDTYGHDAGDDVLRSVSDIFAKNIPSEGYVCRWGGEEILFAVPSADSQRGKELGEKIRGDIAAKKYRSEKGEFSVSVTIGICEASPGEDYEHIISIADKRLYKGKQNGKNQVVTENQS